MFYYAIKTKSRGMQFIKRPNHWSMSDDNADIEWYVQITHSNYVEFKIKKFLQKLLTGHK